MARATGEEKAEREEEEEEWARKPDNIERIEAGGARAYV
jgi:hypothetical protein